MEIIDTIVESQWRLAVNTFHMSSYLKPNNNMLHFFELQNYHVMFVSQTQFLTRMTHPYVVAIVIRNCIRNKISNHFGCVSPMH